MSDYAIETTHLTKRYGRKTAVDGLDLRVPEGSVYAFLGRNGAGKTTTIKILLDVIDATSGTASVLGLDSARNSLEIKRRTGYVSEAQRMYDWMKVDEITWFCRQFYPQWDDAFAADLKKKLDLPGDRKIGELSRGMQGKLALLLAMAFRPELLILDEPTAGLDVVVRHDFLKSIIELIQQEGRTVFFSSHQVHEVERIADWVGIIDEGKLVWSSSVEDLKASVKRIVVAGEGVRDAVSRVRGVLSIEAGTGETAVTVREFSQETLEQVRSLEPKSVRVDDLSLEEILIALVQSDGPTVGRAEVANG